MPETFEMIFENPPPYSRIIPGLRKLFTQHFTILKKIGNNEGDEGNTTHARNTLIILLHLMHLVFFDKLLHFLHSLLVIIQ